MTKQQHLHVRLQQKDEQLGIMKSVLYNMQHGSDGEATELLARLRTGETVEELANIQKGCGNTHQYSGQSQDNQESARTNDAAPSAHNVFPGLDLVHRTLFCPCTDARPSGYSHDDGTNDGALCKRRLSSYGYPIQSQIQLESELSLTSTAVNEFDVDTQDTPAGLSASHLSEACLTGEAHSREGRQASRQYPIPGPSSKQAASVYYFASPYNIAPSNGANPSAVL